MSNFFKNEGVYLRLLVTGGTGCLGSHLIRQALSSGKWREVHATYHRRNPNYQKIFWHFANGFHDISVLLSKIAPDIIIHALAVASPESCERDKMGAWRINVELTGEICRFAKERNTRLIFISSDLIFNGEKGSYQIDDLPDPVNFYGDTKHEAEQLIREGLEQEMYLVIRLALLYGSGLNNNRYFYDHLVDSILKEEKISLYTNQHRSMIEISSAARAILELAGGPSQSILHLGGPEPITRYAFGQALAQAMRKSGKLIEGCRIEETSSKVRVPRNVTLDVSETSKLLSFTLPTLQEGLKKLEIGGSSQRGI